MLLRYKVYKKKATGMKTKKSNWHFVGDADLLSGVEQVLQKSKTEGNDCMAFFGVVGHPRKDRTSMSISTWTIAETNPRKSDKEEGHVFKALSNR